MISCIGLYITKSLSIRSVIRKTLENVNICSSNVIFYLDNSTTNMNWTNGMGFCKENGTYLVGNLNLSNATSACFGHVYIDPRWIGAFREKYLNTDKGNQFKERHMIKYSLFLIFKFRPKL